MWMPKVKGIRPLRDYEYMKVKACMLDYMFKQSHILHGSKWTWLEYLQGLNLT
jgi:hypothetical protein